MRSSKSITCMKEWWTSARDNTRVSLHACSRAAIKYLANHAISRTTSENIQGNVPSYASIAPKASRRWVIWTNISLLFIRWSLCCKVRGPTSRCESCKKDNWKQEDHQMTSRKRKMTMLSYHSSNKICKSEWRIEIHS